MDEDKAKKIEERLEKKFCKDCKGYNRKKKKCKVTNDYTARKNTCEHWVKRN